MTGNNRATRWHALTAHGRWIEPAMALLVAIGLIRTLWFLHTQGHMPPPFYFDPSDTWQDWFNTARWAHGPGAYDSWATIYPPLSFVLLKLDSLSTCYAPLESLRGRDCDWIGRASLQYLFILNIFLTGWAFSRIDRTTALPRAFALTAGLPMLVGFERGNLVLLAFTALVLAFGPLLQAARWRWLALAVAINLKIYLVAGLFAQLLRHRWRWFEGALLAVILLFAASALLLNDGSPLTLLRNIQDFAAQSVPASYVENYFPGTYAPLLALAREGQPVLIGEWRVETQLWLRLAPIALACVQLSILFAAVATWLRPGVVPLPRVTMFGIAFALISSEAGGYTQILLILFVFMESWRGLARRWAIVACYLLCIPFDVVLAQLPPVTVDSFLGGGLITTQFPLTLGPLIRPGLFLSIPLVLAWLTIIDVWRDYRHAKVLPNTANAGSGSPFAAMRTSEQLH